MRLEALVGGAAEVVGAETTLSMAASAMSEREVGALAVVDRRELVGIITERDIVEALSQDADPAVATVADWMTEAPDTFSPEVSVEEAAAWLLETGYRHLPVMAGGELLGVVSIRDILWAVTQTE